MYRNFLMKERLYGFRLGIKVILLQDDKLFELNILFFSLFIILCKVIIVNILYINF